MKNSLFNSLVVCILLGFIPGYAAFPLKKTIAINPAFLSTAQDAFAIESKTITNGTAHVAILGTPYSFFQKDKTAFSADTQRRKYTNQIKMI